MEDLVAEFERGEDPRFTTVIEGVGDKEPLPGGDPARVAGSPAGPTACRVIEEPAPVHLSAVMKVNPSTAISDLE